MKNDNQDNPGIISRWSRRKLKARESSPENLAAESSIVKTDVTNTTSAVSEATDEILDPVLEENRLAAEAVDLETLDYDSDYSVFLKEGVSDHLKRRAMKALWRSSPVLANVDGLCDYDEDFGRPELIMKTFDSAWKVGKGYFSNNEEEEIEVTDLNITPHEETETDEKDECDESLVDESIVDESSSEITKVEYELDTNNPEDNTIEPENPAKENSKIALRQRLDLGSG